MSQLTGDNLDAEDSVGKTPQVEIKETSAGNAPKSITVAPISVNLYRFPVTQ